MDPVGERITESRMYFGHPVDVDNGLRGLAGFVRLGPRAVTLGTPAGDPDYRGHRLWMFHRVPHGEIGTPRVAHHDPGGDPDGRTDTFKIGDRLFHGVRAAARAADAPRFRV